MQSKIIVKSFVGSIVLGSLLSSSAMAQSLTLHTGTPWTLDRTSPANLISNGSFEDGYSGSDSYFAGGSLSGSIPQATPAGWTATGALQTQSIPGNYAVWTNSLLREGGPNPHGDASMYFGNWICASISEMPTFAASGLVTFTSPPTIVPNSASNGEPVTLSQTVTGLDTSKTYRFEFSAGGEYTERDINNFPLTSDYTDDGIMGLDVTGFNRVHLAISSGQTTSQYSDYMKYQFELQPASSTTTFTFINWGHYFPFTTNWVSDGGGSSELMLDDVILNLEGTVVPEPATLTVLAAAMLCTLRRASR